MRLKFRAIKNRLCRARNENIRNIGKNNGLFNADGKGRMGTKEHGPKRSWDPLWDNKRAHTPTHKQMPNNPRRRDTGGTSQLFSPAQSKQKTSTPSESRFQKREKNLDNLWLWEWAKRSTECGLQMLSTWWKNSNGTLRFYIFRPLVLSRSLYSQQLTVRATHPFLCLSHEYKQELKVTQLQLSS